MGLSVERVAHAYDRQPVLRGVSLAVAPGEVGCLLGPSGCGKTTLLRVVAGLERAGGGRVLVGGRVVEDAAAGVHLPPEQRRVGLMFQDYALFPHLTVAENVAFGLPHRRRAAAKAEAHDALARLGLQDYADRYPHMLSSGQQQRCALLRALMPHPVVLLLDEPFSALDVALRAAVRDDTLAVVREAGVATLIVTHDPEEAMAMADRIAVLTDGAIVQSGTPAALYLEPASAFVAALLGPVNRIPARVRDGAAETPLGRFAAPGLADGAAAVLLRPESLIVEEAGANGVAATVLDARLLGRTSHLKLAVAGLDRPLTADLPAVFLPQAGASVRLRVADGAAFVFPAS